eukprot:1844536-Rhodomonas_salina.3
MARHMLFFCSPRTQTHTDTHRHTQRHTETHRDTQDCQLAHTLGAQMSVERTPNTDTRSP